MATKTASYTYLLETNDKTSADVTESFTITTKDATGDADSDTLSIKIVDDAPDAKDDGPTNVVELGTVSGLNAETNDLFGADGKDLGGGVTLVGAVTVGGGHGDRYSSP